MSWLLSKIYDRVLRGAERKHFAAWRQEALAPVQGDVIEIGAGTGANLPYYGNAVRRVVALEPSDSMRAIAEKKVQRGSVSAPVGLEFSSASANRLPFDDQSFDWAVSTLVLCSVADPMETLAELHRVLKPEGRLAFLEHVVDSEEPRNRRRQYRYQPLWGLALANCQVIRDTEASILASGFVIESLDRCRMEVGPKIARPVIRGWAKRS